MPLIGSALSLPMPAGVGVSTASVFSPLDLSPALWLDASDETTLSGPGGGAVSQWSDKSGNGNDLKQASSTYQPITGTHTLNSRNTIYNDGADYLDTDSAVSLTGFTAWMVFEHIAETTSYQLGTSNGSTYALVMSEGSSSTVLDSNMGTITYHIDGTLFTGTTRGDLYTALAEGPHIVRIVSDGTINSILAPFGYPTNPSGGIAEQKMAEVIVVDGTLTAQQIADTEAYLTEKWIPVPLRVGAAAWFDASDTDSITQSGGAVSQWNDLSGNGNNLTQGTASQQPTTGTDTVNGLNVIHYDGNDSLLTPDISFTGLTMIAVFRHSSQNFMLLGTSLSFVYAGVGESGGSSTVLSFNFSTVSFRFDGTPFSGTTRGDLYNELASSTKVVTLETDRTATVGLQPFSFTNDASRPVGDIAEVILVDGTLTADEITLVENYLTEKWITPVPEALGAALWLDASDTSTIVETSGSVSEWQDKSGNGNDLVQATSSLQPTTGTRTLNGLNVIDFIPNDVISAASFNISQPITLFAVATLDTSGATPQFLVNGSSTAFQAFNQTARLYSGTNLQGSTPLALSTGLLFRYTANSTSSSIYVDGSLDVSGDAGTSGMTVLDVGNQAATGRQWDGTVAEMAVFDRVLSDAEIAQMEAYLADKWGIQPIPLQVGATAWFDASDPYTIIETSGAVSQWNDKSGNGNHLTQGTGADQPTTGTRTINGLNVLDFDGTSDYMQKIFGAATSSSTVHFIVLQSDSTASGPYVFDGTDTNRQTVFQTTSTRYQMYSGNSLNSTAGALTTDVSLLTATFGSSGGLRKNGASVIAGDTGTQVLNGVTLARRYTATGYMDGAIAEFIVVDGTLTADEISRVENYLANKWGITL
jgi:hypothetical protein